MQAAPKTPLPQYVDYSPPEKELVEGLHLPKDPSKPQYRVFAACHFQESHIERSEPPLSVEDIAPARPLTRDTPTQDLAEFLRTSKPEDYNRFLKESSLDNNSAQNSNMIYRLLRAAKDCTHKDVSRSTSPSSLPNHVLPKITSRGKPYLQIQVDYAKTFFQSSPETDKRSSGYATSEESSEFNYRNSTISSNYNCADSRTGSPRPYTAGGQPTLKPRPAPWNVSGSATLDAQTLEIVHCSQHTVRRSASKGDCKPRLLSMQAVGGGDGISLTERRRVNTPPAPTRPAPKTPPQSPPRSSTASSVMSVRSDDRSPPIPPSRSSSLRHGRDNSHEKPIRLSTCSDPLYENTAEYTEFHSTKEFRPQRKSTPVTLQQPGPPPTKSLPSLPEGQAPGAPAKQPCCATPLSETRQSREQRVRARKARDMQQIRLQREKKLAETSSNASENGDQKSDYCSSTISGTDISRSSSISSRHNPRQMKHAARYGASAEASVRASFSPITVILDERPATSANGSRKELAVVGSSTLPHSSNIQFSTHSEDRKRPPIQSLVDSPLVKTGRVPVSTDPNTSTASAKELELEGRMVAIERKNKMLEQALMAVIRGSICPQGPQEQKTTEIPNANALEDLMKELVRHGDSN
ncbi:hypothetical protein RUND412_010418, partial [Rhizina undulata]